MLLAIVTAFQAGDVPASPTTPHALSAAPVEAWLNLLLLGGIAGMIGQGARAIVGLKKAHDTADNSGVDFATVLDPGRLFVSFAIGFVAGALAAIELNRVGAAFEQMQVLAFVAAGYIGADFIEGFIQREPRATGAAGAQNAGAAGAAGAGATPAPSASASVTGDGHLG